MILTPLALTSGLASRLIGREQHRGGTVTFVFTDIEGSTRLVQHFKDRWPEVRSQHRRIVRTAFEAHGGDEVDTQGDSFFYVFGRARDAALAAAEAPARARRARVAGGRRGAHPHRHAHRRAGRVGGGLPRHRRPPRGADHVGGPRRPGAALGGDCSGAARRGGRGRRRPRPGRPPPEGPRPAGARLPARRGRARSRTSRRSARPARRSPTTGGRSSSARPRACSPPPSRSPCSPSQAAQGPASQHSGTRRRTRSASSTRARTLHDQATGVDEPHGAASGAGAIWVTSGARSLTRIDPQTHQVQTIDVGAGPEGVAVNGNDVWVANSLDNTVSLVSAQTNRRGGAPTGGQLADRRGGRQRLGLGDERRRRDDHATRRESGERVKTIDVHAPVRGIAYGGGSLWVTDPVGNAVIRVPVASQSSTTTIRRRQRPDGDRLRRRPGLGRQQPRRHRVADRPATKHASRPVPRRRSPEWNRGHADGRVGFGRGGRHARARRPASPAR